MKRRDALKTVAALPAVASAQSAKRKTSNKKGERVRSLGTTDEGYECQFLALFLAMLISQEHSAHSVTYWVDTFSNSGGNWNNIQNDPYFSYSTKAAYLAAYDLLITKKKYPSLLAFQKDYRLFSQDMLNALKSSRSGTQVADDYPDICPFSDNITALLDQVG